VFAVALTLGSSACSFPGNPGNPDVIDGPGSVIADGGADAQGVVGWTLRTREELADPGADPASPAAITGGVISPRDLVEPSAYAIGGLLVRASTSQEFIDPNISWAAVTAFPATNAIAYALPTGEYFGPTNPRGVGIADPDFWTVWGEGEIFLEAGTHAFQLDVDDAGFIEIDAGGTRRISDHVSTTPPALSFAVAADGWYPIRVAVSDFDQDAWWRIRHDPPGAPPDAPLGTWRLRHIVDGVEGVSRTAFDSEELGRQRGVTLLSAPLLVEDYGAAEPSDLGISNGDYYSQRFAGQVWVDAEMEYAATVDVDDGFRLALDGTWLADELTSGPAIVELAPVELARGWHDLVFDHQENAVIARAIVSFTGTPTGPIPASVLRPVVSARDRVAAVVGVPQNGNVPATVMIPVSAPPDAEVLDVTIVTNWPGAHWDDDVVDLQTPWGTQVRVRDRVNASGALVVNRLAAADLPSPGARPAAGMWLVTVDDVAGGNDGTLQNVELTIRYRGGPGSIAPATTYTSGVHDFGTPRQVSGVAVRASTPDGSGATLGIRTCDVLPCTGAFLPAEGFPFAAARYAQVQVQLTSDGSTAPFVDDIDVYVLP
jgi:subtilisin-like proprotein convertase family protein